MPGNDDQEKARNYARVMAYMIEDAFPTRFLVERLRTDDLPDRDDLIKFFEDNPDFNLQSSRVGSYLSDKPEPLVRRIRAMQRIYKLAPRHAHMSVLLKDGVDSAYRVARMGRNVFTARFGESLGSRAQAGQIYENALQVRAMAMTLLSAFGPNTGRVPMRAVPDVAPFGPDTDRVPIRSAPDAPMRDVDDGVPDWSTLFGTLDLCECESCRSIHGPAAYLVDVLHFLSDRKVIDLDRIERNEQGDITKVVFRQKQKTLPDGTNTITDLSVKDVLFERRPDLGEIELTCENTDTLVPYVDLVNEALENAVAPPPDFAPSPLLPADLEVDLNGRSHPPSDRLRAAFNPQLSAEAVITVGGRGQPWPNPDPWWTIDEPAFTYTIRKEDGQLNVVSRSRQTKGSAAERAANPQYVNLDAYEILRQAVYPWTLPYDLWSEEIRTYLGHLGVPRHRIIEIFLPGADRREILSTASLACEYLGLTPSEADIITGKAIYQPGAASAGPWNLWGFTAKELSPSDSIPDPADSTRRIVSGHWLTWIRRVDVFLQQSGLKYKELLELLDTHFINPITSGARGERSRSFQSTPRTRPLAKRPSCNWTSSPTIITSRLKSRWWSGWCSSSDSGAS